MTSAVTWSRPIQVNSWMHCCSECGLMALSTIPGLTLKCPECGPLAHPSKEMIALGPHPRNVRFRLQPAMAEEWRHLVGWKLAAARREGQEPPDRLKFWADEGFYDRATVDAWASWLGVVVEHLFEPVATRESTEETWVAVRKAAAADGVYP